MASSSMTSTGSVTTCNVGSGSLGDSRVRLRNLLHDKPRTRGHQKSKGNPQGGQQGAVNEVRSARLPANMILRRNTLARHVRIGGQKNLKFAAWEYQERVSWLDADTWRQELIRPSRFRLNDGETSLLQWSLYRDPIPHNHYCEKTWCQTVCLRLHILERTSGVGLRRD